MKERRGNQFGERELDDPVEEFNRLCEQLDEVNQGIASLTQQTLPDSTRRRSGTAKPIY